MPIPYLLTALLYIFVALLAAADASLISLHLASSFYALKVGQDPLYYTRVDRSSCLWVAAHVVRFTFQKAPPSHAMGYLADHECRAGCTYSRLFKYQPADDTCRRHIDLRCDVALTNPFMERTRWQSNRKPEVLHHGVVLFTRWNHNRHRFVA